MDAPNSVKDLQIIPARELTIDIYHHQNNQENETDKTIKSSAVGLYSSTSTPPKFSLLQCNTNLNMPPANWLSRPREILGPKLRNPQSTFTSFHMASNFLNCVGEVDVVCDAENIKKLLKIPYSKAPVSMMVHRVGKTLLLDDFDIHTHLLRTSENEWAWLKKFYLEHIFGTFQSKDKIPYCKSRHNRDYLQQQNLISKFLYHSLALSESETEKGCTSNNTSHQVQPIVDPLVDPLQEIPHQPKNFDHQQSLPQFSKNIVWTFEDLRMLIGTDMPIFGGGTHPCLSLRLRDMNKPINVLTGLDYWLDNLMCNVPEVVMCYHLGGLVQKYELIKTDDLPRLPGSQFKPGVIRDVAQNILSFLKSKATKAGHTYWLFKGKDDDIVKLYDLTSLCTDLNEDLSQNPFTTPVAMLLFKVARNLKMSSDWKRHQSTVLALLKNCLSILDVGKYPQVATAALYYIMDLYLPTSLNIPNMEEDSEVDQENWEYEWEENELEDQFSASVDVAALSTPQSDENYRTRKDSSRPPTVPESLEQRCTYSLQHAIQALEHIIDKKETTSSNLDEPAQATPLKPIPMPYLSLNGDQQQSGGGGKRENSGTLISKEPLNEWKQQYWRLLIEKCILAHVTLADSSKKTEPPSFEDGLSHLRMAALLWIHLDQNLPFAGTENITQMSPLQSYALSIAGDLYFSIVQQWDQLSTPTHKDFNGIDLQLLNLIEMGNVSQLHFSFPSSLMEALEFSVEYYRLALLTLGFSLPLPECPSEVDYRNQMEHVSLTKRLGNAYNELGAFFMSRAAALIEENEKDWKAQFIEMFHASQKHLEKGVDAFTEIKDSANIALLYCNLGKLYRIQARALAPLEKKEISFAERKCYTKAMRNYKLALEVLERRELNSGVWDAVIWEYTCVLFTLASLLQDYAPLSIKSREEVEDDIKTLLETCIEFSEGDTPVSRKPLYQYRSATCHYRIASLLHNKYRNGDGESVFNGINVRSEAEDHYTRASALYVELEHWDELIRLQLEKAGLYEFQLQRLTGVRSKVRTYESMLKCYLSTLPCLVELSKLDKVEVEAETLVCVGHICSKTQSALLQLTKLSRNPKNTVVDGGTYRKMYAVSLNYSSSDTDLYKVLFQMVKQLVALQKSDSTDS